MANFTSATLRHTSVWNIPEAVAAAVNGFPATVSFKWNQGYEVLHFINRYMAHKGWQAQETFQAIESTIKTRLPFTAKSHNDVMKWLDANFKQ